MTGEGLATVCACGHMACYHPSPEQQATSLAASGGRYAGECKGAGIGPHCRCTTDRAQVMQDPTP